MVPNHWKRTNLINATSLITKGATPTTSGHEFIDESNDSIMFLGAYNCSESGTLKLGSNRWITQKANSTLKRSELHEGDTVICIVGSTIGSSFKVKKAALPANINQNVALIRPKSEIITEDFLSYLVTSDSIQAQIRKEASTQAQPSLSLKQVGDLQVLLPSISEQNKITKIISAWDQAIAILEQLIEQGKQQKKSLEQKLLTGKLRAPKFHKVWQTFNLGHLFSRITEKNNNTSTNVVTISAQQGLVRQEEFFNKTVASEKLDSYFLLRKGQFAYNKSYSNGYPMGAIKRLNKYEYGVVTPLYICFDASNLDICHPEFFEHYFDSGLLNIELNKIANEGGRANGLLNVKPADFFGLKVFIPCVTEQKNITKVLSSANREIEILQRNLCCLKQEKKALMQQLLTGKRRVHADEMEIA
jgi:type I restriction enzyme S subunit